MEIKIMNKPVEVEREWKVGDVFLINGDEPRMIIQYADMYYALDILDGQIMTDTFKSIDKLMEYYYEDYDITYAKSELTLTEE